MDNTDKIKQEHILAEAENRFRLMAEGTQVLIAVGDETGKAVYFNKAWAVATGRSIEELLEFGWADLMHADDKEIVMSVFNKAFVNREPWTWEFRMPAPGGGYRWLLSNGVPMLDSEGNFTGYISSSVDISVQKEHQIELAGLNKALLASNEKLLSINNELQRAQGDLLASNLDLANSERNLAQSNSKLQEREHLLELSIQSAGMGTWTADLENGTLTLSERSKIINGIPINDNLDIDQLINKIDPVFQKMFIDAVNTAIAHESSFVIEYRINMPDKDKEKWLRTSGIVHASDGKPKTILGTILDVTEQKLNEQRKNEFISMVSHELKTPLTSINGYVQILLSKTDKARDNITGSLLSRASSQIGKMTALINGFLNVSRLESAKIYIERSKFNMAQLCLEVEEESLASIPSHHIVFAPVEETLVIGDRDKIGQVINNLIANAVKYSPAGSTINIACITKGDWATLSVSDQGIGISEQNLPRLFERYYRVEDGLNGVSGFGIGLYLCYEIVKLHDGHIWAESKVGKGSTFSFTIPVFR